VTTQEYNLGNGNLAFRPTHAAWATSGTELTGEIKAPTDLGNTAHPVIVLLHGRHVTTYDPVTGGAFLEWPPTGNHLSIPSYRGYDYLGDVLASQGYVVVSIGANGINARDNNDVFPDFGMTARAELMQRTFGILQDLNTDGVIQTRPADATHPGTDLFTGTSSPFGTRYVGHLDLQNIGIMGHSRGGEGVVSSYRLNQSLGSPYGIKAVFALAPVDFIGNPINNVPFAVLLPYNDGDVSDLQGAHFFDDSRYNVAGDTGPKFSIEVMGANHNYYNTVWSPGLFPFAGAPSGFGGTGDDALSNQGPPTRLTEPQEQATGLAYMTAFFRTYVGGETQFLPIMTGDAPPPASSTVGPDRIHIGYLPPDDGAARRDINRLLTAANLTTNTLGGTVVTGGLAAYSIGGPTSGEVDRDNQLHLTYSNTLAAFYENDLPRGQRDERAYSNLDFRIGVNWTDTLNPLNVPQDFTVTLTDGAGNSASTLLSAYSNDLFYPPRSSNPHEVLNTVRIPLSAFGSIDLSNVTAVRFNFDQTNSGAYQIADIAFADAAPAAGPYVVGNTPGDVFGPQTSVRVQFDRPINVSTFTTGSIDSFTRTVGSTVTNLLGAITGVTPVAGSNNRSFDITFSPQSALGAYQLVIGPNIFDTAGTPMDQNHNLIAREIPDDEYIAAFSIGGPKIISSTPSGNNHLPGEMISSATVTFNEPVDPSTFALGEIPAFHGSDGFHSIQSVAPVAGSNNTSFRITFAPLTTTGSYTMLIGPDITDLFGHRMDQDGNFIDDEFPGDTYALTFGIQGLQVVSATPNGNLPGQVQSLRVVFNEPVNLSSVTTAAFVLTGPDGNHMVFGVPPVSGSNFSQFDVLFAPLTKAGSYTIAIGPNIRDVFGNAMDTDGDLVPGEATDVYTTTFNLTSPTVLSSTPTGTVEPPIDHVRLRFDRPMAAASFSFDHISLTGPDGSAIVATGAPVPATNNTQFDITFAPQIAAGDYTLVLDGATDTYANPLAAFTTGFTLASFHVLSTNPSGTVPRNTDHVVVTFDRPVDPTSFHSAQVSLTGPGGPVTVTNVMAVAGSNNTQFTVSFTPLATVGTYTLTLTTDISDSLGNALSAPYTATLTVQVTYIVSTPAFQNLEIFGQAGTQTLTFTSGQVTADDDYGTIDLGSSSFTFYGQQYSTLYVSSNGAITFGAGTTAIEPSTLDSRYNPALAFIAPYWTDLYKDGNEPMIVWRIDGDQLTIEWYRVTTFTDGTTMTNPPRMTFQVILNLNTGVASGDIVYNYVSVTGRGDLGEGIGVTAGVKNAGTGAGVGSTYVEFISTAGDPRVQSGKAVRLTAS
jgi:hypothetical protein